MRRFRWYPNRLMALALIIAAGGGGAALALARPAGRSILTGRSAPEAAGTAGLAPPAPAVPAEALAAAAPVRIDIPSIAVSAPVDPVGLNPDGSLQAPKDFGRTAYYTGRPTPGEVGPAVIEGHVDSPHRPAVFYGLRKLRGGDEVVITENNQPGARLIPAGQPTERKLGKLEGTVLYMSPDSDAPLDDFRDITAPPA